MRPKLTPGLRWAWRSPDTVQFGIDVPHPIIVSGLPSICRPLLVKLDGSTTQEEIVAQLIAEGLDATEGRQPTAVLEHLAELGLVVDGGLWPGNLNLPRATRERLMPDVRCASALEPWRREPAVRWDALARSHVTVVGVSRLGAAIARSVAAAGVGRLEIEDTRKVSPADVSVGGFAPEDVGRPRSELLSARPTWAVGPPSRKVDTRLVVVTDAVDLHTRCRTLAATGTVHLVVSCQELIGRIGPFVEPGRSACHFCLALTRRDLDPAWADIWRQQASDPTPDADAVLVGITAGLAAAHIIDWLTGGRPPSLGGFVEVVAPHGVTTQRSLPLHPECGCTWPEAEPSLTMAR